MDVLKGLKIEKVRREQIWRFMRIVSYLEKNLFPEVPRVDKTKPDDKSPYTKEDILPPEEIYFGSFEQDRNILNSDMVVGIIGTTSTTSDGDKLAILLAHSAIEYGRETGKESLVVAGGVYGIDEKAHFGALDLEGRTIAVVANPVEYGLHPYEPRRKFLEEGILRYGGLVSEQTEYKDTYLDRCMQRNRIVSAMSDVVVVVESGENSGTVDNAIKAMLQGVPLVVIDWNKIGNKWKWSKPKKEGNEQLLKMRIEHRAKPYGFPERKVGSLLELGSLFKEYLYELYNS